MNAERIAEALKNVTRYDEVCGSYGGCYLDVTKEGDYVRLDAVLEALGLEESVNEHGVWGFYRKNPS
jgi:hypothetical protein